MHSTDASASSMPPESSAVAYVTRRTRCRLVRRKFLHRCILVVELAGRKVDNVRLSQEGENLLDKGDMRWVLLDVVLAVLGRGKFDNKRVRDSLLMNS